MSIKSYLSVDAKCPFYKGDDGHSMVCCEGVRRAVCIKVSFHLTDTKRGVWSEKKELKKFFYEHCADEFESCPLYKMIMKENYPEEKNEDNH